MNSIIVATNFTANSENAAFYAADLALAIGMDIRLINVLSIPTLSSEMPIPQNVFDDMRDSNWMLLERLSKKLTGRTFGKVRISIDLEIGDVVTMLTAYCKDHHPFMVVMGTSGHTLENVLTGSTTVKQLRQLHCPILVIPPDTKFHTIQKVVVAVDKEDLDSGKLPEMPLLKELSQRFGSNFEVVHVLTEGKSASEAVFEYDRWKDKLSTLGTELRLIRQSDIKKGIIDYLGGQLADWLLVLPKRHSWLEFHKSNAKQILSHSPIPVVSVHE